jgi:hypothetical protein
MYPAGGYGVTQGMVLPPQLSWQGFTEGAAAQSNLTIQDYFDCDGSKNINALLIDVSATWCGACQQEAQEMPQDFATFSAKGIRVLTLMIEDANSNPASVGTAKAWRDNFNLSAIAVAADPTSSVLPPGSVGLPYQILVDPRTMKVVSIEEGYSGDISALVNLATKNKNP